jgi:hypothetical protein
MWTNKSLPLLLLLLSRLCSVCRSVSFATVNDETSNNNKMLRHGGRRLQATSQDFSNLRSASDSLATNLNTELTGVANTLIKQLTSKSSIQIFWDASTAFEDKMKLYGNCTSGSIEKMLQASDFTSTLSSARRDSLLEQADCPAFEKINTAIMSFFNQTRALLTVFGKTVSTTSSMVEPGFMLVAENLTRVRGNAFLVLSSSYNEFGCQQEEIFNATGIDLASHPVPFNETLQLLGERCNVDCLSTRFGEVVGIKNAYQEAQNAPQVFGTNINSPRTICIKIPHVALLIIILFLIIGAVVGGIYLLRKNRGKFGGSSKKKDDDASDDDFSDEE